MGTFGSTPSSPVKAPTPNHPAEPRRALTKQAAVAAALALRGLCIWEMLVSLSGPPPRCVVKGNLLNFSVMG